LQKSTHFRNSDIIINTVASNHRFITPISTGNMRTNVNRQAILDEIASDVTVEKQFNIRVILFPMGGGVTIKNLVKFTLR